MRKISIFFSFLLAMVLFTQCKTEEDRTDINGIAISKLSYTETQTVGYDNQLIIKLLNNNAVPFYEVCRNDNKVKLLVGNLRTDTIVLPFQGEYMVRVFGYFNSGIAVDSFKVSASQPDPVYFANPYWTTMSNSAAGKAWTMASKYVGPESNYHSNWYQPSGFTNIDTIYFDLNFAFTYKKSLKDVVTSSTWSLSKDTFSRAPTILSFGSTTDIGDNDNGEMSSSNQNKYRIVRCTADTIVFSQGASLTASRTSEDWAWYWVFTPAATFKK